MAGRRGCGCLGDIDDVRGLASDHGQAGLVLYDDRLGGDLFGNDLLVAYREQDDGQQKKVEQHNQQDEPTPRAQIEAVSEEFARLRRRLVHRDSSILSDRLKRERQAGRREIFRD